MIETTKLKGGGFTASPRARACSKSPGPFAALFGVNGAAPTWADVVELENLVATGNADVGRLAYLTSPGGRAELKTTAKDSGSGIFLWERNEVNGAPAFATTNIAQNVTKGTGTDNTRTH